MTLALNFSGPHAKTGALDFAGDVLAFNFFFLLSYLLIFLHWPQSDVKQF